MSTERRAKLEAYAQDELVQSEHSSATVSDRSLTKDRLIIQENIRSGCLLRLDNLIAKVDGCDFSQDGSLAGLLSDLSHYNILDYRDQFSIQTYEAIWQRIHELKISLEKKGIYYDKQIQVKLSELNEKLEKNRLRVVYVFDPIILRTQIFDNFRKKKKELRDSGATREEIQALKDETREKLILCIELLSHLQQSFSQAYQELFPRLMEQVLEQTTMENPYPSLDLLDVVSCLETGLVDYGITTNIHRNNIIDHLELLTDGHNRISRYLESFSQPLDGSEFFRIYTEYYLGKKLEPTGKVNLISQPPYRDLTFECETDKDYFILYSGEEAPVYDESYGINFSSMAIPNGLGEVVNLPISVIRGLSQYRFIKHEDAHSLQSQYFRFKETKGKGVETIASDREKWVSVFDLTYDEAHRDDVEASDWRLRAQIDMSNFLNQAIVLARGEIQAYTRDGNSVENMIDFLTDTSEDALYDYLNSDRLFSWLENKLSTVSGFDGAVIEQDILETKATYSQFLTDALGVVDNYLRLLGNSHGVRETASIIIRFTTLDELKWLVNLLQERNAESLTYDPSEQVVAVLGEVDESLGYDFIKILAKWGSEVEKNKSLGMENKSFGYIIGHMRWNNYHTEGASVKALSNPESVLIVDKPTTSLRLKSKEQFVVLCRLLGLISPDQTLSDLVRSLGSRESIDNGYQYHGEVIHNVPTKIAGMSLTAYLGGNIDGSINVDFNFDLEVFHLMLNQMGYRC